MNTKKHDDDEPKAKTAEHAAPKAAEQAPPVFPFTGSINEPQTVSLPLPQGTVVPKPSITALNPDHCVLGEPDFTLYVSGTNFFADSVIVFASHDEPTTLNQDGTLSTGINMAVWQGADIVPVVIKNGPEISDPVEFEFAAAGATRSAHKRKAK
jgi:hypothetical protein